MKANISSLLLRAAKFVGACVLILAIGFVLSIMLNDVYIDMKHAVYDAWCGR